MLNRAQRREFAKRAKANQLPEIKEGDRVMINAEKIKSNKSYDTLREDYKEFVESSCGVVFTAHVEQYAIVSLVECPNWLFWTGDLVRV